MIPSNTSSGPSFPGRTTPGSWEGSYPLFFSVFNAKACRITPVGMDAAGGRTGQRQQHPGHGRSVHTGHPDLRPDIRQHDHREMPPHCHPAEHREGADCRRAHTSSSNPGVNPIQTAETFDPTSTTFTATLNQMTQPRELFTATLLNSGNVLLAGGDYNNLAQITATGLHLRSDGQCLCPDS